MEENKNYSENDNLVFKRQILKFYPEDEEKMAKMSVQDRIEYRRKLKEEGRYTIDDGSAE